MPLKRIVLALLLFAVPAYAQGPNQARMLSGVNAQTGTSYTFQAIDVTKVVTFCNAAPIAVTLPAATTSGFGEGTIFTFKVICAGQVTITPASGTINGVAAATYSTDQGGDIYSDGTNYVVQSGAGTGGGGGSGTVTSVSFPTIPTYYTATVTNPTTTPSIAVAPNTGQPTNQVLGTGTSGVVGLQPLTQAELPSGTLVDCGIWDSAATYQTGCVVQYGGSSYKAVATTTGVTPGTDTNSWKILAQSGTNGTNGVNGVNGTPGFSPNQIVSGGGTQWTGNYDFTVGACNYIIQNTQYNSPSTNITLTAADPSLDRIDTIYVNTSGAVGFLTGTPSANPTPPSVTLTTQLALTFVYVTAGSTQPTKIASTNIYLENTEWTCTASAHLNCASTNNPYAGSKDIEATSAVSGNNVTLVKPAAGTEDLSTYNTLFFYIRSKAAWPSGSSITLQWLNASTPVGSPVVLNDGQFNFNSSIANVYQQVAISTALFATGTSPVTTLSMTVGTSTTIGFYVDNVLLQSGQANVTLPTGIVVFRGTWNSTVAYNTNDLVTNACNTAICSYVALSANTNTAVTNATVWRPLSSSGIAGCTVNGLAYYSSSAGITCVAPPTTNGNYQVGYTVTGGVAVAPAAQLSGLTQNAVSGATSTFTVATAHCGGQVISHDVAGSQSVAITLPTATTLLNAGCAFEWSNYSTHDDTITPTTWTVNGAATLVVKAGAACLLTVDKVSATNWLGDCHVMSTTGGGSGITSINTSATGPAVTIAGAGGATVSTNGNTITVNGSLGPPSPTWQNQNAPYTVPDSDNGYRDRSPTAGIYTLGTPNTNASSPLVALRVNTGSISSTPFTSSSFAQSAGHQMLVAVARTFATVTNVTNSTGDSFTKKCEVQDAGTPSSLSIWYASNLTASGSATLTVTFSATPGNATVYGEELQGTTFDSISCVDAASGVTTSVHFASALAFGVEANNANAESPGFTTLSVTNSTRFSYRLLANASQVTYNPVDSGITQGVVALSSASVTTYATGWSVVSENVAGGGYLTVTPTAATVNGQSSNIQVPNMSCNNLAGAANYDAICGFVPNINVDGNIGAAIEIGSRITNNTGSDIGSTTIVTTGAIDGAYTVEASITCRSAVAGQPTLTIGWTDTSNTAQTKATTGVDCTSLGASSWGSLNFSFRAKASTNITLTTTHGNSQPTVDVDVSVYQRHTQ